MVAYEAVQASNSRISTELPSGLVAVFVGATSGIGEYTLKAFVKHAKKPRIYFIGRSQAAADRILTECHALNPGAKLTLRREDVSMMQNVDTVCEELRQKEPAINILCVSQGTLYNPADTDEGLRVPVALAYFSRVRFMLNLLPNIQAATGLRRVLSIFAGGKEGPINLSNVKLAGATGSPLAFRGHMAAIMTLAMETLAARAPTVSWVHDFPGPVKSQIARDRNMVNLVVRTLFTVLGPFMTYVPNDESGERHVHYLTSGRYPAADARKGDLATDLYGVEGMKGTTGAVGSGVYTPDERCDPAPPQVETMLAKMRTDGVPEKVWKSTEEEFKRITGKISL